MLLFKVLQAKIVLIQKQKDYILSKHDQRNFKLCDSEKAYLYLPYLLTNKT